MADGPGEVTQLLARARSGDARAADVLLPMVYGELRALAQVLLGVERPGHTLQPTALVHEAYVKLVGQTRVEWRDQAHFFSVASQAIRRILVDHARTRKRVKRGSNRPQVELHEDLVEAFDRSVDLLALDEALAKLERTRPRAARVVELRFFGGLSIEEAADVLGVGTATIEREWRLAKAVLHSELNDE